jgi:hypothetical protein
MINRQSACALAVIEPAFSEAERLQLGGVMAVPTPKLVAQVLGGAGEHQAVAVSVGTLTISD